MKNLEKFEFEVIEEGLNLLDQNEMGEILGGGCSLGSCGTYEHCTIHVSCDTLCFDLPGGCWTKAIFE